MIHVCYALFDPNGTYSKFVGTSIFSLFYNTQEKVTIHILHDDTLTEENRKKFLKLAETYNQNIKFYLVIPDPVSSEFMKSFTQSPAALYRLKIAELLPDAVSRAIYLDADIIVNMDIKNLWEENIYDYALGAVLDTGVSRLPVAYKMFPVITQGFVKRENYFNSGVLLMNLNKFRNIDNFYSKTIELFRNNLKFFVGHDQDLLNYLFSKQYQKISNDYNRQLVMEKGLGLKVAGKAIYHYINNSVDINSSDNFDLLYWSYFIKTPWFDEKVLLNGFRGFQIYSLNKQAIILKSFMKSLYTCRNLILWGSKSLQEMILNFMDQMGIKERIYLINGENEHSSGLIGGVI